MLNSALALPSRGANFRKRHFRDKLYVINGRCLLLTRDNHRVVPVSGVPIAQYVLGDHMSEAHARKGKGLRP